MGDGMSVADWIHELNRRVYVFAGRASMEKVLRKYVERDGAQELVTFSPIRFLRTVSDRLELSAQNSGAIARRAGPQKFRNTFLPLEQFPTDRRPAEITVVDGIDDLSAVDQVVRHYKDGRTVTLPL